MSTKKNIPRLNLVWFKWHHRGHSNLLFQMEKKLPICTELIKLSFSIFVNSRIHQTAKPGSLKLARISSVLKPENKSLDLVSVTRFHHLEVKDFNCFIHNTVTHKKIVWVYRLDHSCYMFFRPSNPFPNSPRQGFWQIQKRRNWGVFWSLSKTQILWG